jgi:hypothetical protein
MDTENAEWRLFFGSFRFFSAQNQDHESRAAWKPRLFKGKQPWPVDMRERNREGRSGDFGRRSSLIFEVQSFNSGESLCSEAGSLWMHGRLRIIAHLQSEYIKYLRSDVASRRRW